MLIKDLELSGLKLIIPKKFDDERGYFSELYRANEYAAAGIVSDFVQDNFSVSKKGTLRGMHFQAGKGQAKLVSVIQGEIYDVVVDMRPTSPTYKKWLGIYLKEEPREQLYIPVGFAHGFCVLSEMARVLYKVSTPYDAPLEKNFHYADTDIAINWPIQNPLLSPRDEKAPPFVML